MLGGNGGGHFAPVAAGGGPVDGPVVPGPFGVVSEDLQADAVVGFGGAAGSAVGGAESDLIEKTGVRGGDHGVVFGDLGVAGAEISFADDAFGVDADVAIGIGVLGDLGGTKDGVGVLIEENLHAVLVPEVAGGGLLGGVGVDVVPVRGGHVHQEVVDAVHPEKFEPGGNQIAIAGIGHGLPGNPVPDGGVHPGGL